MGRTPCGTGKAIRKRTGNKMGSLTATSPLILFLALLAYAFGSIPFGLLIGRRFAGTDIRRSGSGNIGATNVGRVLGKKWGVLTLCCDVGKAVVPLVIAMNILEGARGRETFLAEIGLASFLGHIFPAYLKFKGGKGVATALGGFLVLTPWVALAAVPVFLLAVLVSGYVSVGSLSAATAVPVLMWVSGCPKPYTALATVIAVLVWIKHRGNVRRLIKGEEKSYRRA
ncbi:MAG: glycerol-3-phosphate 1-O-acyltransferase PlsY [Pseudomonadota bacterium]